VLSAGAAAGLLAGDARLLPLLQLVPLLAVILVAGRERLRPAAARAQ